MGVATFKAFGLISQLFVPLTLTLCVTIKVDKDQTLKLLILEGKKKNLTLISPLPASAHQGRQAGTTVNSVGAHSRSLLSLSLS